MSVCTLQSPALPTELRSVSDNKDFKTFQIVWKNVLNAFVRQFVRPCVSEGELKNSIRPGMDIKGCCLSSTIVVVSSSLHGQKQFVC